MNLEGYILNEIKGLHPSDSIKSAQQLFQGYPITHVPVIENGHLKGCISESDAQTIDNTTTISEHAYLLDSFSANENTTILELIKLFADFDCNVMPVLNKKMDYLGYYELSDILDIFSNSPFLHIDGTEIIAEKSKKEFSVSEVSQIIESNNGRLLGFYISHQTPDITQITVKVISEDMNEIIQTFRRYNYNVVSQFEDDFYLQDLRERSNYLQKYLDM